MVNVGWIRSLSRAPRHMSRTGPLGHRGTGPAAGLNLWKTLCSARRRPANASQSATTPRSRNSRARTFRAQRRRMSKSATFHTVRLPRTRSSPSANPTNEYKIFSETPHLPNRVPLIFHLLFALSRIGHSNFHLGRQISRPGSSPPPRSACLRRPSLVKERLYARPSWRPTSPR